MTDVLVGVFLTVLLSKVNIYDLIIGLEEKGNNWVYFSLCYKWVQEMVSLSSRDSG